MTDETRLRIDHARRAQLALDEFLTPAIGNLRATYQARMGQIIAAEPWEVEKIKALVMAIRLIDTVEAAVTLQVKDGEAAKHDLIHVENISNMSHARRRALGV